jgi:hypothetical protein
MTTSVCITTFIDATLFTPFLACAETLTGAAFGGPWVMPRGLESVSAHARAAVEAMLVVNREVRPSAADVLRLPAFVAARIEGLRGATGKLVISDDPTEPGPPSVGGVGSGHVHLLRCSSSPVFVGGGGWRCSTCHLPIRGAAFSCAVAACSYTECGNCASKSSRQVTATMRNHSCTYMR